MPDIDQRQQGKDRRHDHAERAVRTGKNGLAARIAFVALICHTPQLTKILMPSNGRGKFLYPAFARAAHLVVGQRSEHESSNGGTDVGDANSHLTFLGKQAAFHQATDRMRGHDMDLLNKRRLVGRRHEAMLANRLHRADPAAGKAYGCEPAVPCGF
jgi:hypothetical protein